MESLLVCHQFRYDGLLSGLAVLERLSANRLCSETFSLTVFKVRIKEKAKNDETTER
jgi:hypothetical protein